MHPAFFGRIAFLGFLLLSGSCFFGTSGGSGFRHYGQGARKETQVVPIAELLGNPAAYDGKTVQVEGQVVGVCAKRGCWIEIAAQTGSQKVKFKVQDGVMVFPVEEQGHHALADGVVRKMALDLEQTRAYRAEQAREAGQSFDPASVTGPMDLVMLEGLGAIIYDTKP